MSAELEKGDESIEYIDRQLADIQEQINKLNHKKRKLEEQKNQIKEKKSLKKSLELSNQDWDQGKTTSSSHPHPTLSPLHLPETYSWSKSIRIVLRETFKMKDFRPQQLRTINALLNKNDVILVAPTGGGKSLCFQLPALMTSGLTVVVSPLISLMEDQLENLKKYHIEAAVLSCSTDKAVEKSVYQRSGI